MSGGGGSTNTIQSSTPWSGVQPGLEQLYGNATNSLGTLGSGPQAYTGQTTAPLNSTQNTALQQITDMSNGANATNLNTAQQQAQINGVMGAQGTLSGEMADQAMMNGSTPAEQGLLAAGNGTSAADQSLLSAAQGTNASGQYLQSMLQPGYTNVNNNAALQQAMQAANYNTNFNYTNDVMPQLASQFSAAGRFGSGAQTTGINQANNTLASQISNTNASMSYQDLQQLMANQLQAGTTLGSQEQQAAGTLAGVQNTANQNLGNLQLGATGNFNATQGGYAQLLPSLGQMGFANSANGLAAGNQQQAQSQTALQNLISQYNTEQMQPYTNMGLLSGLLSSAPWGTVSSGNTSNVANPYSTALGAGTLGLAAYNSMAPAAAAAGTGALFSSTAGLTGAALDSALAAGSTDAVIGGMAGGGTSALLGLAAA